MVDARKPGAATATGSATAVASTLPAVVVTDREHTNPAQALLSAATRTVGRAGRTVFESIAHGVAAPGNVHTDVVLAVPVGLAGSAASAAPVIPTVLADARSKHTRRADALLATARAGTVGRAVLAVLIRAARRVSTPRHVHTLSVLASMERLAGPTHTSTTIGTTLPIVAGGEPAGVPIAGFPAGRARAIHQTGPAILRGITGAISTPGDVLALTVGLALMVSRAGSTGTATPVTTAHSILAGNKLAGSVQTDGSAGTATAVHHTGLTVLTRVAGAVPTPGDVDALPVITVVMGRARAARSPATIVATQFAFARGERTRAVHALFAALRASTVSGTRLAVLGVPAVPVPTVGNEHTSTILAIVVNPTGSAGPPAAVITTDLAAACGEHTGPGLTGVPAGTGAVGQAVRTVLAIHRLAGPVATALSAVPGTGLTRLVGVAEGVSAGSFVHTLAVLTHM